MSSLIKISIWSKSLNITINYIHNADEEELKCVEIEFMKPQVIGSIYLSLRAGPETKTNFSIRDENGNLCYGS